MLYRREQPQLAAVRDGIPRVAVEVSWGSRAGRPKEELDGGGLAFDHALFARPANQQKPWLAGHRESMLDSQASLSPPDTGGSSSIGGSSAAAAAEWWQRQNQQRHQ